MYKLVSCVPLATICLLFGIGKNTNAAQRLKDTRAIPSPTFGVPQDTFIVGCELYLFGRFVAPVEFNGQMGHRVTKTATAVYVNDIIFLDGNSPTPTYQLGEDEQRRAAAYRTTAEQVRKELTIPSGKSFVIFRGTQVALNQEIRFGETEDGEPIWVEFRDYAFALRIRGAVVYDYNEKPRTPVAPEVYRERVIDGAYSALLSNLRPGAILVAGRGYFNEFRDPTAMDEFRAALAAIPIRARRLPVTTIEGQARYDALRIGSFYFNSDVVHDFAEAAKK